jgi:hypothetical protein
MTAGHVALQKHPVKAVPCELPGARAVTDRSCVIPTSANVAKTVRFGNTIDATLDRKKTALPMESPTDDWLKVTVPNDCVAQNAESWMNCKVGGKCMVAREIAVVKAELPTVVRAVWLTSNVCSEEQCPKQLSLTIVRVGGGVPTETSDWHFQKAKDRICTRLFGN